MAEIERINCLHYKDAKLFHKHLRELEQQDPGFIYFRGQAEDWPLMQQLVVGMATNGRGNG